MTLSEFKAWFEGYTEGLEGAPTKAQFDRIKEKVKEIDGAPVTQTIWLNDYRYRNPYYAHYPYLTTSGATGIANGAVGSVQYAPNYGSDSASAVATFDSHRAMFEQGKAEAAA